MRCLPKRRADVACRGDEADIMFDFTFGFLSGRISEAVVAISLVILHESRSPN